MTPPSSPRAGRSTVSAAGEAGRVLRAFRKEMPGMPTADYAVLPMTLLLQVERVLAEAAESRPSVTMPSRIEQAYVAGFFAGNAFDSTPTNERIENYARLYAASVAASPAGPEAVPQSEREGLLREALEHVIDVWSAPSPEEFARLHRVLTGHDSCSPAHPDEEPR